MVKQTIKKFIVVLLTAGICAGLFAAPVFAAEKTAKTTIITNAKVSKKSARYIEPEEWNQKELFAYLFDTGNEMTQYVTTGGLHYYNDNYKEKDHWIKVTLKDSGLFYVMTASDDGSIQIYDQSKKNRIETLTADEKIEYMIKAKAGDVFYIKLPKKIEEQSIVVAVLKDGFGTIQAGNSYGESATGNTMYHSFSIAKRSLSQMALKVMHKDKGNVTVQVQKYVKGNWINIGYKKTIKPRTDDYIDINKYVINGLQAGKYRVALNTQKGQVYCLSYGISKMNKNVAYTRSKAKKIKKDSYVQNIYTQGETASRWYKFTRKASDKVNVLNITKATNGGGFKFTIYKKGKKKPIKTIKVKTNESIGVVNLPKGKGTYYVKVNKLTKKTNGTYTIMDFNAFN
ncbi:MULTISPECIES: hypothetical protein [unclassified Anaerostipes]|jgi:phenylpyruvate tautomerase PptA (4-oxalocrotonate tautomerase family)|uniref:hypothetical protein n=1 Tax=unclassified Anaerostipes TaxID=2635253 RepID=UPI001BA49A88|nr:MULTISPECIES: hypothetical protein [unclassified Anaerostipes]MBR9961534.1 hypothetical protein [Anaerostipes sp. Marseille-Q3525]MED9815237.1 hypothetical protein [Anaerostipes sp.]